MNHTPAPWRDCRKEVNALAEAIAMRNTPGCTIDEVAANASLIMQAPALRARVIELERALSGMLAIEGSVTQQQEAECRAYWVPIAREALGAGRESAMMRSAKEEARPK